MIIFHGKKNSISQIAVIFLMLFGVGAQPSVVRLLELKLDCNRTYLILVWGRVHFSVPVCLSKHRCMGQNWSWNWVVTERTLSYKVRNSYQKTVPPPKKQSHPATTRQLTITKAKHKGGEGVPGTDVGDEFADYFKWFW
jgi:hypothetical protein